MGKKEFRAEVDPKVKAYYVDILCQQFSPCGNLLAAGTITGEILIFDLRIILNPTEDVTETIRKPWLKFSLPREEAASAFASTDKFLIVGALGRVYGYDWKAIQSGKSGKICWSWDIPKNKQELVMDDFCNSILINDNKGYVASGDANIYAFSLEDGRMVQTLAGHEDFVHQLCKLDEGDFASAGEDGTVRLWDTRIGKTRSQLIPNKEASLQRQEKWVGAIYSEKDWLICGGGVRAGLWHIPTLQLITAYQTENVPIRAVMLNQDHILIGGQRKLQHLNLAGDDLGSISCSSNTIISLAHQEAPHWVLAMAGTSPRLDICTNWTCRDQVLTCS